MFSFEKENYVPEGEHTYIFRRIGTWGESAELEDVPGDTREDAWDAMVSLYPETFYEFCLALSKAERRDADPANRETVEQTATGAGR